MVSSCNALLDLHNEILEVIQVNSNGVPILRKKIVLREHFARSAEKQNFIALNNPLILKV